MFARLSPESVIVIAKNLLYNLCTEHCLKAPLRMTCDRLPIYVKKEAVMAHSDGSGSLEDELTELRKRQEQVVSALQLLFDLLEAYAPPWYEEEHHKKALAALQLQG